jgi:hypothetical protein
VNTNDLERELNLSGIDRLLGVGWRDRCDYCGWPLAASMDKGCVADNCSQRPRPLAMTSEAAQEIRRMEARHTEAAALVGELAGVLRGLEWSGEYPSTGHPCCPDCAAVQGRVRHSTDCRLAAALAKAEGVR